MRKAVLIIGLIIFIFVPFSTWYFLDNISDPLDIIKSRNPHITQQQIDMYKQQYGLDKPTIVRFFYWVRNAARGDFGALNVDKELVLTIVFVLIASLLSGIGALFALKKPIVSMFLFIAAFGMVLIAAIMGMASYIFVGILLVLAILSYFGNRELQKGEPELQPADNN